ncbi:MAG: hypothetical protein ACI9P3_000623 [Bradyrhizobium sp.]|jgi:hypothetical protein
MQHRVIQWNIARDVHQHQQVHFVASEVIVSESANPILAVARL